VQSNVVGYVAHQKVPTVYSYSIGVQRGVGAGSCWTWPTWARSPGSNRARPTGTPCLRGDVHREGQDPTRYGGVVPAVEPGLPAAHRDAGLSFSGVNGLNPDQLRPYAVTEASRFRSFDSRAAYNSLQVALQRRFSRSLTFGVSYTLSTGEDGFGRNHRRHHPFDCHAYATPCELRTPAIRGNYVWNLPGRPAAGGGRWAGRPRQLTCPGSRGSPPETIELGLNIAGVNAGRSGCWHRTRGNAGGSSRAFRLRGTRGTGRGRANQPRGFAVPGVNDRGP